MGLHFSLATPYLPWTRSRHNFLTGDNNNSQYRSYKLYYLLPRNTFPLVKRELILLLVRNILKIWCTDLKTAVETNGVTQPRRSTKQQRSGKKIVRVTHLTTYVVTLLYIQPLSSTHKKLKKKPLFDANLVNTPSKMIAQEKDFAFEIQNYLTHRI